MGQYIEVEGDKRIIFLFEYNHQARTRWLKELIVDLGEFASKVQRIYAPMGESGYLHEHLGKTGLRYHPAGRGGHYSMEVGVRRGSSKHPFYVHGGTANVDNELIGDLSVPSTPGRIYPRGGPTVSRLTYNSTRRGRLSDSRGFARGQANPALTFQKKGEPRKFRAWVSGQRPQPFVYISFVDTLVYAKGRARSIAALFPEH